MQARLEKRLQASELYTRYLKVKNLLDDEEHPEWQQIREWTTQAQKTLEELRTWNDETRETLTRLEQERATHGQYRSK